MKNLMLSTAILAGMTLPAMAQDTVFRSDVSPGTVHASDLIGARLYASEAMVDADAYDGVQQDWNDIGEVNDVIISRDGAVEAVLVDIGGFLGIGERQTAVDMSALRFVADSATADAEDDWFIVVNADRATLEAAPEWTMPMMDGAADQTAMEEPLAEIATTAETATPAEDVTMAETDTAATDREPMARDGYTAVTAADLTADGLLGANVYDVNDKDVGTISDLVMTDDGQVSAAIIDVGGFLGMGEKPVEIMIDNVDILRPTEGGDVRVYLSQTEEDLEAMPAYSN